MPMGDGTGPPGGGGPGTGRGRGRGFRGGQETNNSRGASGSSGGDRGNKSESLIAIIGGAIALATSIVKLLSRKKQDEKK